jgi:hypothetical protein
MSDTPITRAASEASAASPDGAARSQTEAKAAAEPLTFREKLEAGRFVVSVEVDPQHVLVARKEIEGSRLV